MLTRITHNTQPLTYSTIHRYVGTYVHGTAVVAIMYIHIHVFKDIYIPQSQTRSYANNNLYQEPETQQYVRVQQGTAISPPVRAYIPGRLYGYACGFLSLLHMCIQRTNDLHIPQTWFFGGFQNHMWGAIFFCGFPRWLLILLVAP